MMMDNGAADVSGSTPLIPAPEEASDWSSSSLPPALSAHPSLGDFFCLFVLRLPSSVSDQVLMLPMRCAGLVFRVGYRQVQQSGFDLSKSLDRLSECPGSPCHDRVEIVQSSLWNKIQDANEFRALLQTRAATLAQPMRNPWEIPMGK